MYKIIGVLLFGVFIYDNKFCSSAPAKSYPLKLQPEFDRFDVGIYFQNDRLMRLQFHCLMFDGPCDIVGKFVKARAKGAMLGRCDLCTPKQEKFMSNWFSIFKNHFPEMYQVAFKKFVEDEGLDVTEEFRTEIKRVFSDENISQYLRVYKIMSQHLLDFQGHNK